MHIKTGKECDSDTTKETVSESWLVESIDTSPWSTGLYLGNRIKGTLAEGLGARHQSTFQNESNAEESGS